VPRTDLNGIGMNTMKIHTEAIDDAVLALVYLTLHNHIRARKSFDCDSLSRL
jgi:hypothetical protein